MAINANNGTMDMKQLMILSSKFGLFSIPVEKLRSLGFVVDDQTRPVQITSLGKEYAESISLETLIKEIEKEDHDLIKMESILDFFRVKGCLIC